MSHSPSHFVENFTLTVRSTVSTGVIFRGGSSHLVWGGSKFCKKKLKPHIVIEQEWLYWYITYSGVSRFTKRGLQCGDNHSKGEAGPSSRHTETILQFLKPK